ncbi:MAG: response regulator [Deltaproteobacteria bacterium]|jgi:DNA-binding NtrC family response regulator|nr:response regulator [Deltaproteobacteria bacterium]MBW2536227.1 response regulator [Deltaproteobacteria bacterium]
MGGTKVLLVDDEEDFVGALARRLESRGLQVTTAENGKVALEKAQDTTFDAVVLDLAMPTMDGIETLKRLRELNPDLQIILLTGHATVQKGVEAMKLGAMDLLEKPAEFQEILQKIEQASERSMVLVEKRTSEEVAEVLRKKGW